MSVLSWKIFKCPCLGSFKVSDFINITFLKNIIFMNNCKYTVKFLTVFCLFANEK